MKRLRPSEVRFTQDSIAGRFQDGRYLSLTFEQLLDGVITTDDIEDMEVVYTDENWWALTGNRRLYIYRRLQELGVISTVSVRVKSLNERGVANRFNNRHTTENDGKDIVCRQPQAERIMNGMVEKWRRRNANQKVVRTPSIIMAPNHLPSRSSFRVPGRTPDENKFVNQQIGLEPDDVGIEINYFNRQLSTSRSINQETRSGSIRNSSRNKNMAHPRSVASSGELKQSNMAYPRSVKQRHLAN